MDYLTFNTTQILTEEQKTQTTENIETILVKDALLALLPKAMEVAF